MCNKAINPDNRKHHKVLVHTKCNLLCRVPHAIPVILHNGLSRDFHLLVKHLEKIFYSSDFNCLGENT